MNFPSPAFARAAILIIDHAPADLAAAIERLERQGMRVLVADNGEEGLRCARYSEPDLILLDVALRGTGGIEICRRLKDDPATRDIPVMFTTALAATADRLAGFKAGAVDFLAKPFNADELLARAGVHIALRSAQRCLATQNLALQREVAERRRAEDAVQRANEELAASEERYRKLVLQSVDAILLTQDGTVVFANPAALALYGAQTDNELLDRPVFSLIAPESRAAAAAAIEAIDLGEPVYSQEERGLRLDGTAVELAVTRIPFVHRGSPAIQTVVRDVSERKALETRLQHQATHDALTGLPNRSLFTDRLGQAITHARRHGGRFVVCFLDLDHFKWINDSLGHEAGDRLLKTVAQRMSECLRETDTVARLGGDEFVLLLADDQDKSGRSRLAALARDGLADTGAWAHPADMSGAMLAIGRLMASVGRPVRLGEREHMVSCSMGCSSYPEDGTSAEELLKFADAAMYQAKADGRNRVKIYNATLRRVIDERVRMEAELRHALERDQLFLHYQPQVDLGSGAIRGVEALLRWQHPELGMVPPLRFIPLAEEIGLIDAIGAWALRHACLQAKAWQDMGIPPVRVAVNLSAHQLTRPGLDELVAACLADTGLDPAWLELEITESAPMRDPERALPVMRRLKALGVSLSLDDFGTGYSNMYYLKRFPVNQLKLDGSFVQELTRDADDLAIADAIMSMAHRLGMEVVAEKVETEGQAALLAGRGCDTVQGYYFSKPLPATQCEQLLRAGAFTLPKAVSRRIGGRTLLVLDDDPMATAAVARALRHRAYRLLIAHCADEAFELLACNEVDVILSDQRMPGLSGVEFLDTARRLYPRTARLMFTGYPDVATMTDAINRGAVHKFLAKPYEVAELLNALDEAFALYDEQPAGRRLARVAGA